MADFACSDVGIDRKSCVATHRSSKRKEEREPTGTLANVGHGLRDQLITAILHLNEHVDQSLRMDDFTSFIGLFNLPGALNMSRRPNSFDQA
ncbi:hypothetical protein K443DRAFT_685335 [Laccaria amethystina LaAM-08-1]|uniref:Uncharacterized protein n=1 Tax=Laccaria amethystina LaAM-08-1 TaxID=1095629 RepID=A0A0C9X7E1_9AGAR|nr:hypothetical protein K443DRAFT_685335 [Laccaria amethystina LaAM-08-1]